MTTYRIISKTDPYNARRYGRKIEKIEISGLTLEEAQKELLRMFNSKFDTYYNNWGLAVIHTSNKIDGARPTFRDGTRAYTYDIWQYYIEEEVKDC